jgi:hypothetical protein
MQNLIKELSFELWKSINDLDKTFQWNLNWFYYKKVEILWKSLDEMLKLQEEENNIINK